MQFCKMVRGAGQVTCLKRQPQTGKPPAYGLETVTTSGEVFYFIEA